MSAAGGRYSVVQERGGGGVRFYAIDLTRPFQQQDAEGGRTFYPIVGSLFGYADANAAWAAVERARRWAEESGRQPRCAPQGAQSPRPHPRVKKPVPPPPPPPEGTR